jgi:hypothetical protein
LLDTRVDGVELQAVVNSNQINQNSLVIAKFEAETSARKTLESDRSLAALQNKLSSLQDSFANLLENVQDNDAIYSTTTANDSKRKRKPMTDLNGRKPAPLPLSGGPPLVVGVAAASASSNVSDLTPSFFVRLC